MTTSDDEVLDLWLVEAWKASVRSWLERRGLTITWLADETGFSLALVSAFLTSADDRIRLGKKPLHSSKCAAAIARVTGIPRHDRDARPILAMALGALRAIDTEFPSVTKQVTMRLERLLDGCRAGEPAVTRENLKLIADISPQGVQDRAHGKANKRPRGAARGARASRGR